MEEVRRMHEEERAGRRVSWWEEERRKRAAFDAACDDVWRAYFDDKVFPDQGTGGPARNWSFEDADKVFLYIETEFPDLLKEVACVVCCLPVSQATSMGRLLSAVEYVSTGNKNEHAGELLDAVLFLRANKVQIKESPVA
jgi:hypothetical protein